ncbi:hypothetical protein PFISCL1PPCAC_27836, partial [Pristionchus fissidentatus]
LLLINYEIYNSSFSSLVLLNGANVAEGLQESNEHLSRRDGTLCACLIHLHHDVQSNQIDVLAAQISQCFHRIWILIVRSNSISQTTILASDTLLDIFDEHLVSSWHEVSIGHYELSLTNC